MTRRAERSSRCERGQALVEMALVVVTLTFLVMGILEVGFAFMRTNMIVNAARDGARFAATLDSSLRDSDGCFTDSSSVTDRVDTILDTVGFAGTPGVSQGCEDGIPTVTVTVTGTLNMLFGFMGSSYDVDRSVTFEDEGREFNSCTC